MNRKILNNCIIGTLILTLSIQASFGQEQNKSVRQSNWSFEYSIVGSLARIHAAHFLWQFTEKSEVMFGPCFQNYENAQGSAHAYTFLLGYRHTFWKNLILDYELFPAYNEFESKLDGETHTGLEVYSELRPGYRFNFIIAETQIYILPQLTIGYGLWTNNKLPDFNKQSNPAIMANLWIGINL